MLVLAVVTVVSHNLQVPVQPGEGKRTMNDTSLDHEQRIYGWLHQVVRDMRVDILWAMQSKDAVAGNAKLQQVINYCNLALAEADRQQAAWRAENEIKRQAALVTGTQAVAVRQAQMWEHERARVKAMTRGFDPDAKEPKPLFLQNATKDNLPKPTM